MTNLPRTWIVSDQIVLPGSTHPSGTSRPDSEALPSLIPLQVVAAAVGVRGSTISDVVPLSEAAVPGVVARGADHPLLGGDASDVLLDRRGKLVSPGFVNAHTHLAMSAFRGVAKAAARRGNVVTDLFFELEKKLTAADVRAFTRLGAYECLLNGVVEVWDHYYFGEAIADGLLEVGLTGVVAPTLQDLDGPGATRWEAELASTHAIASSPRLARGGVYSAFGPHATDTVSEDLWRRVAGEARDLGVPIHAHLAQSYDEYQRCQSAVGCSPVEWLNRMGVFEQSTGVWAHAIFVGDADLSRLFEQGQRLVSCPFSQLQFAFAADVAHWDAAGIPWAVATDCVASNDSMNLQKELRLIAGFGAMSVTGSQEYQAFLEGAARDAAQDAEGLRIARLRTHAALLEPEVLLGHVFGIPGQLHPAYRSGSIEVGARANLVLWDLSHASAWPAADPLRLLAYADLTGAIDAVMVLGHWLAGSADGQFAVRLLGDAAYADARREADARLSALLG